MLEQYRESQSSDFNFDGNSLFFVKSWDMSHKVEVASHFHSWLELAYYEEGGTGEIDLDGTVIRFGKGDLLVVKPYAFHSFKTFAPMKYVIIGINMNELMSLFARAPFEKDLSRLVDRLYRSRPHYQKVRMDSMLALQDNRAPSVFAMLEVIFHLDALLSEEAPLGKQPPNEFKILQILNYLERHSTEKLSLDTVARKHGLGKSTFCRFFKKTMGVGFTDYLNKVRIKNAEFLLQNSSKTVTEIAFAVGFNDTSYFIKIFQKYNRMTPSEFKKSHAPASS